MPKGNPGQPRPRKTHCKHGHEIAVVGRSNNGTCKACLRQIRELRKNQYNEKNKQYALKWRYNLSIADYNSMLVAQGGVCAICKRHPGKADHGSLHVDHCHNTGTIRGLLCMRCNTAIGKLDGYFQAALNYLEKAGRPA